MNFFEAQDFFKKMHPGKKIIFEFDEKCHRVHELIYTDGNPNVAHHVENNQVKVTVEGMAPFYVPIAPHREIYSWVDIKRIINSKNDIHINESDIEKLKKLSPVERDAAIIEIAKLTGVDAEKIKGKIK